jgi:hypothetical protein
MSAPRPTPIAHKGYTILMFETQVTDLQTLIALPKEGQPLLIQTTNRAGEVSVGGRVTEIQTLRDVVRYDPGEDRVLVQIVVRPSGQQVQLQCDSVQGCTQCTN